MGNFPGRAGLDMPVALSYSSKVWRMDYAAYSSFMGNYYTSVIAKYGEHSASGWTSSLGFPFLDTVTLDQKYDQNGTPTGTTCGIPCYTIDRVLIWMPDGSSHELRSTDQPFQPGDARPDILYSVDSSRLRYQKSTSTLFMPDGSRYILNTKQHIDRNGNTLTYNAGQWTDTLGHSITDPLSTRTSNYAYSMPGVSNSSINYTFKWKSLDEPGVLADSQQVRYIADSGCPNGNGSYAPYLFPSASGDYTFICNAGNVHRPSVLYQIVLPTGQTYTFNYNIYGEIVKVTLPTSGYEKYEYDTLMPLSRMNAPYNRANRGVVKRWISESGTGTDEILWQYGYTGTYTGWPDSGPYVLNTIAPDMSLTEYYIHTDSNSSWGYSMSNSDGARVGRVYDMRFYSAPDSSGNRHILRRNLTRWDVTGSNATSQLPGLQNATRDPRAVKEVEILFEDGGSSALARMTEYTYDQYLNNTSVTHRDYVSLSLSNAQTFSINQIPAGAALVKNVTTYLVSDPNYSSVQADYIARNLTALSTSATILDGSDHVIAQTSTEYDNYSTSYPLLNCSPGVSWVDLQTNARGNPTKTVRWLNFDGVSLSAFPAGSYLHTDIQFDKCGNVRNLWDTTSDPNSRGHQTQIDYDSLRVYPHLITSPVPDATASFGSNVALVRTKNYDSYSGRLLSTTDANGQTTNYSYDDPLNRLSSITYPQTGSASDDKGMVVYTYSDTLPNNADGSNYVRAQTRIDNSRWTDSYQYFDGLGRPSRSFIYDGDQSGPWSVTDKHYDIMGHLSQVSNPYRVGATASTVPGCSSTIPCRTTYYDELGRVKSIFTPDEAQVSLSYGLSTSPLGSVLTITDQAGKTRTSITNALGKLARVIEAPNDSNYNYQTNYQYDVLGNLHLVTQGSQERSFMYDSLSRLIRAKNPEQDVNSSLSPSLADPVTGKSQWSIAYSYDPIGNIKTRTDARGIVTTYNYDALNRNITVDYSNTTLNPDITRHYDTTGIINSKGRLTSVTSEVSTYNYTGYDAMGRVTASSQTTDGQSPYLMAYEYDLAGNMTKQVYPSGRTVKTQYDTVSRIAGVYNQGNSQSSTYYYVGGAPASADSIGYTANSGVSTMKLGNGLWEHINYNNRLQISEIGLGTSSTLSDKLQLTYSYDATDGNGNPSKKNNGNVLRQVINVPAVSGMSGLTLTQHYQYDPLNRLSGAQEVNGVSMQWQSSPLWQETFSYDAYGNRTAVASSVGSGQPALPTNAPEVDSTTNRLKKINSSGQTTNYDYDAAGNLKQELDPVFGGSQPNVYSYDGENRMLDFSRNNTVLYSYAYDGDGRRVKKVSSNAITIYAYNIMGQVVAEYSTFGPLSSATKYVTGDALGSTRVVTDSAKNIIARYDYLPFGEQLYDGISGRSTQQGYGGNALTQKFTGKERDFETNLDFFNSRYYSSNQGRFTSPDSVTGRIINPQTLNLYSYVKENPLKYVDPTGHFPQEAPDKGPKKQPSKDEPDEVVVINVWATRITGVVGKSAWESSGGGSPNLGNNPGLIMLQGGEAEPDPDLEEDEMDPEEREEKYERLEELGKIHRGEQIREMPDMSELDDALDNLADRMIANSAEQLKGDNPLDNLKDALERLGKMEGTPQEKANAAEAFLTQIKLNHGWQFNYNRGSDGSYIFNGSAGYKLNAIVISPRGEVYTGTTSLTTFTIRAGIVIPNYRNLRRLP
ncbi:MAG: RHS repeat-associated core domain-containing protein [Pyrinomonadaceae bacterium]